MIAAVGQRLELGYQNQLLALAQNSLIAVEPTKRNISSLLVGVDEDCFSDLNEMTLEFRRRSENRRHYGEIGVLLPFSIKDGELFFLEVTVDMVVFEELDGLQ